MKEKHKKMENQELFEAIQKEFKKINKRFDQLENRIEQIEKRLDDMEITLKDVNRKVSYLWEWAGGEGIRQNMKRLSNSK